MMSRALKIVGMMVLAATPALAQPKPADTKTPEQKPAVAVAPAPPLRPEAAVNVKIELTITDQRGTAAPVSKVVTITMADMSSGRLRTGGDVRTPLGFRPVTLNVDGSSRVQRDGKIRVDLTLEYRPTAAESDTEQSTTPTISENVGVLLEDGKSIVISQSADPATDRKVKVEVKATIIR
jgi:type 1 fimbria pilin